MRKLKLKMDIPSDGSIDVDVGRLFKAFCEEYSEHNVFTILKKELHCEVFFDQIPNKIVEAISSIPFSTIEELNFEDVANDESEGGESEQEEAESEQEEAEPEREETEPEQEETEPEQEEAEPEQEETEPEQEEAEPEQEEIEPEQEETEPEQEEAEPEQKEARPKQEGIKKGKRQSEVDQNGQRVFDEIAEQSGSFEEFLEKFGRFLSVNEYYWNFYMEVMKTACDFSKMSEDSGSHGISWKNIERAMLGSQQGYTITKQIALSSRVKKAFRAKASNVTALMFISEAVKYQNYNFSRDADEKMSDEAEAEAEVEVENEAENEHKNIPEYQVLSNELVELARNASSFTEKVEIIFDRIKATDVDIFSYAENKDKIISVLVESAVEYNSMVGDNVLVKNIKMHFSENEAYRVVAFIYQSIKNYCQSVGYSGIKWKDAFFSDLKLMK